MPGKNIRSNFYAPLAEKNRSMVFFAASLSFFLFLSFVSFFKDNGLREMSEMNTRVEKLESEKFLLASSNDYYRREIGALKSGDFYIEKIARERLGLVKPDEVTYEFLPVEKIKDYLK